MITAKLIRDKVDCTLDITIEGHAGYNDPGKDIVCAAVSALALAVHAWAENHKEEGVLILQREEGKARLAMMDGVLNRTVYEVFRSGILCISAAYPDFVQVEEEILRK